MRSPAGCAAMRPVGEAVVDELISPITVMSDAEAASRLRKQTFELFKRSGCLARLTYLVPRQTPRGAEDLGRSRRRQSGPQPKRRRGAGCLIFFDCAFSSLNSLWASFRLARLNVHDRYCDGVEGGCFRRTHGLCCCHLAAAASCWATAPLACRSWERLGTVPRSINFWVVAG